MPISPTAADRIEGSAAGFVEWVEPFVESAESHVGLIDWKTPLGRGEYGMVFPLVEDPGHVVKWTTDPAEGPVAQALRDTGLDRHRGVVRFEGVWVLADPAGLHGFLLYRENIQPLTVELGSHDDAKEFLADQGADVPLERIGLAAAVLAGFIRHPVRGAWRRQDLELEIADAAQDLQHIDPFRFMGEAIEQALDQGIVLGDLHEGNVGYRTRKGPGQPAANLTRGGPDDWPLLMYDLGHSSAAHRQVGIEVLRQAVQENPVLRAALQRIPPP